MASDHALNSWRDGVEFVYVPLEELAEIGDITFLRAGRFPGHIAFGNELFHFQAEFECRFTEGYVAQSPGLVDEQKIQITLNGKPTVLVYDHSREIGNVWFGYRPIIEITTPDGQRWHFSFRRVAIGDCWCRLIPANDRVLYGCLERQAARLFWLLMDLMCLLIYYALAAIGLTAVVVIVLGALLSLTGGTP